MTLTMDHNMKASVLGGTFFSSIVHIGVEDIFTTTILAVVGAIVSFIVSVILKFLFKKFKNGLKK